mmetsp:Transcript_21773/g.61982  ORF Transcript_21773/g.61982 Transcript_21773/m.61982 type:complete len:226 (+) Transcript_21773:494-1171(+)
MEHLLAKYREILPLFFASARPMKVEWYMRPYFGVFPLVFNARKSAFSAPRICTVDAGALARFVREPALLINLAATVSPMRALRFGATIDILSVRYMDKFLRNSASLTIRCVKLMTLIMSMAEQSMPMLVLAAAMTAFAVSSSPTISTRPSNLSQESSILTSSSSSSSLSPSPPALLELVRVDLSWMNAAALANMMLSLTISFNSGKCQLYHSRTRMANVLMSLSI